MSSSRKCVLLSCKNKYVAVNDKLSYHGLPRNPELCHSWLQWISVQNKCSVESVASVKNIFVCSDHFKNIYKSESKRLKSGAIPTEVSECVNNSAPIPSEPVLFSQTLSECSNNKEVVEADVQQVISCQRKGGQLCFSTVERVALPIVGNQTISQRNQIEQFSATVQIDLQSATVEYNDLFVGSETIIRSLHGQNFKQQFSSVVEIELQCPTVTYEYNSIEVQNQQYSSVLEVDIACNIVLECPADFYDEHFTVVCDLSHVCGTSCCNETIPIDIANGGNVSEPLFGLVQCNDSCNVTSVGKDTNVKSEPNIAIALEEIFYDCNENNLEVVQENLCKSGVPVTSDIEHVSQILSGNLPKKKNWKKCSGCDNPVGSFFSFPAIVNNNPNGEGSSRFKTWVCNSGNLDLLKKRPGDLHKQNFLCSKHFEDDQFYSRSRNRLVPKAEPTKYFDRVPLADHIMNDYLDQAISMYNLNSVMFETDNEEDLGTAEKLDLYQKLFNEVMFSFEWETCQRCHAKFYKKKHSKQSCVYTKKTCEKFAELHLDDIPEELKDLTFIEEQLISKVHPIVSVIKLKSHQLGYQGNVINFPQDVKGFARKLPHRLDELSCVLTVRASKNLKPVDFQVRAAKVKSALEWLKRNNKFYHDIEISKDDLDSLPENSNVFELLNGFDIDEENTDAVGSVETEQESLVGAEGPEEDIYESGSPIMAKATGSDQVISLVSWPTISSEPINEFQDYSYIAQAFPCLFPKGNGIMEKGINQLASTLNYFKHLMRYKDNRFATHNRFRYFALNSFMRWSALRNGNLFVRTQPEFENMTLDQLKQELKKNPGLIKKLMYRNSSISGSKSYWFARGKELLNMVEQIGLPTLFCTLSAADLHWPDLFRLLAPDEDFNNMSNFRRRQLVKLNPMIVDSFFLKRAEEFMDEVLVKKFKVKDYWFRIEYQHRGSPHLHGVLWLDGAPDVTDILKKNEEEQQAIVDYFSELVTAFNPNMDQCPSPTHPCQKKLLDVEDLDEDLISILNKVQRHTICSTNYCIRKSKQNHQMKCRFKFPQEYQASAKLNIDEKGNVEFLPKRNDARLNKYNRYIIQTWRANIDVAPVISKTALINYLAKYISKSEKRSDYLAELMTIINEASDSNKTAKHVVQRLYIKACSERDFSAQETCHLLMGSKLYSSGGRGFVTINFNDNNEWRLLRRNDSNAMSLIEKYQNRSKDLEPNCLFYVAQHFQLPSEKKLDKSKIVQIFPKYSESSINDSNIEKFCRQQVLLYVPWRDENKIKANFDTWKEVYDSYKGLIEINSGRNCILNNVQPDEEEFEESVVNHRQDVEEWMTISDMGPSQIVERVPLGCRDIDVSYNWHESLQHYDKYGGIPGLLSFLKTMKKKDQETINSSVTVGQCPLNDDQQKVLNLVHDQIRSINGFENLCQNKIPRTAIVQGKAGTGKSLLIARMADYITRSLYPGSVLLLGPTGVSALNINGSTIHSKLLIRNIEEFESLNGQQLHNFKKAMENVRFVIFDEMSMIGCNMMFMIDQRLRQAKDEPLEEFGGLFIYLFGDINQLPPVLDSAAYSNKLPTMEAIAGKVLYDSIEAAFILEQIHRQNDEVFRALLNNIGNGEITEEDYKLLESRFESNVTDEEELKLFANAPHFYPTNIAKDKFNETKLSTAVDSTTNLFRPVAKIPAKCSGKSKRIIVSDELNDVESTLFLSKGCNIMLRTNLWTEKGLVNGSVGEVVDIVYDSDAIPQENPPAVLICTFESYKGPYLDAEKKTIPIAPYQYSREMNNEKQTLCQFPLCLNYGCTIHKSQGLTVERAFVDIGPIERQSGLTYVALSRVKSLNGLLLNYFPWTRCERINKSGMIGLKKKWLHNLRAKLY